MYRSGDDTGDSFLEEYQEAAQEPGLELECCAQVRARTPVFSFPPAIPGRADEQHEKT